MFMPNTPLQPGRLLFSVDEFATGLPLPPMPNVSSESPVGDGAADAYMSLGMSVPAPVGPGLFGRHVGFQDGDGLASGSGYAYPGVGLIEPIAAFPGPIDTGDNIDALDAVQPTATPTLGWLFSLDSAFFDPFEGVPNSGSAVAHGYVGGDVLIGAAGGPLLYAPAAALGLDLVGGPDSDDLDALIVNENGVPGYQISHQPYAWITPNVDMLVFSVRRGSAVIGMPDSILGVPIEEGDLLVPPLPPAAGGVSPYPGILFSAESLGLATVRSTTAFPFGDDLNAADSINQLLFDCDGDGIEDAVAIAMGTVPDVNMNGIPDPCEAPTSIGTPFCFCTVADAPCANPFPAGVA